MELATTAANLILWLSSLGGVMRWRMATRDVRRTQSDVLFRIVRRNAGSAFGIEHGFSSVRSIEDYQCAVPIRSYDEFVPYIRKVADGEPGVLTREKVLLFEPTSGSTTSSKLIPYTRSLKSEFQAGIDPWLFSLFVSHLAMLSGKAYWSVTPIGCSPQRTSGGIAVGFEDDAEYLGFLRQKLIRRILAVPSSVSQIRDMDLFRRVTLLFLLRERNLVFVSVWNPTFLTLLLEPLASQLPDLLDHIHGGTLVGSGEMESKVANELGQCLKPQPARAAELNTILDRRRHLPPNIPDENGRTLYESIWPRLSLISCWADARAARDAGHLATLFPNVPVQPKGLVATEGFVSFPSGAGTALSLRSHFFEFMEPESGHIGLAHELEPGGRYSVILTTSGGLYRYRLYDRVEVTGFENQCPLLRFERKEDGFVDLFGEKLNEIFVRRTVERALRRHRVHVPFWMLAPERPGSSSGHYTWYLQPPSEQDPDRIHRKLLMVASTIEEGLRQSFHYDYCRRIGQLTALRTFVVSSEINADTCFLMGCTRLGQRLGDVKGVCLHPNDTWSQIYPGDYLQSEVSNYQGKENKR